MSEQDTSDTREELEVDLIPFASLPDGFDYQEWERFTYLGIALAWFVPYGLFERAYREGLYVFE